MMKRFLILLFVLLVFETAKAQFVASGDVTGGPYSMTPLVSTGLDKVYVYENGNAAVLTYTTSTPGDWTWYRYEKNPKQATALSASDVQVTATGTTASNLMPDCGYFVESGAGLRHYCFIIQYHPAQINDITFTTEGDPCNILTLQVNAQVDALDYYTVSGIKRSVSRDFTLSWNSAQWSSTSKKYETLPMTSTSSTISYPWSVTAPLKDTYFTLTGDQIAKTLGSEINYVSAEYKAVAVEANPLATPQVRNYTNEKDRTESGEFTDGSTPTGSAPLTIDFKSYPSESVKYFEWFIYGNETGTGSYNRFSDEDLTQTFLQSGKFLVKLFVSNGSCKDSASFTPKVTESMLDCPNFFTPRSSKGENDEFRVVYRSLVRFKGTIINRWGNVLFQWSDPGIGWDGTYKGKPVSPGVYFYLIEAKGSDGIEYKKKGDINILE